MATRGPEATRGWVKIVVRRRVSLDGLQQHPGAIATRLSPGVCRATGSRYFGAGSIARAPYRRCRAGVMGCRTGRAAPSAVYSGH